MGFYVFGVSYIMKTYIVFGCDRRLHSYKTFVLELAPPVATERKIFMDKIQHDIPLSLHTTFKIGGNARYFFSIKSVDDIKRAIIFSREKELPFFVLGGGSNLLVSDDGFIGVVLKIEISGVEWRDVSDTEVEMVSGAGEVWDDVVSASVERGLSGFENLSGIPGTVGAGPVQNIGAYGREIKDTLSFVEVFDTESFEIKKITRDECLFSYRDSIFKKPDGRKYIITKVVCVLNKKAVIDISYKDLKNFFASKNTESNPSILEVRNAVLDIRKAKLPNLLEYGTAGSFFKNPIVSSGEYEKLLKKFPSLPAFDLPNGNKKIAVAWVLDNVCKYKGYRDGNVGVYKNQPLVLVNFGGGTASEIKKLSNEMSECVEKNTGLKIFPEIVMLGF